MPPTYQSGWIYVLENPHMPGIFKIGCTERTVEERILELSNVTGVPSRFVCVFRAQVRNPRVIERTVHEKLSPHNTGKEFFRIDFDRVVKTVQNAVREHRAVLMDPWQHPKFLPNVHIAGDSVINCPHCNHIDSLEDRRKNFRRAGTRTCTKCGIAS